MDLFTDMSPERIAAEIKLDLQERAARISDALVAAFGGVSQIAPEDIGRALAGGIINNGLTVHGTVDELVTAVCGRLYADHDDMDRDSFDAVRIEAAMACRDVFENLSYPARLRYWHLPVSPYLRHWEGIEMSEMLTQIEEMFPGDPSPVDAALRNGLVTYDEAILLRREKEAIRRSERAKHDESVAGRDATSY